MICPQASSPSLGEGWGGCLSLPWGGSGWVSLLGKAGVAFRASLFYLLYHSIGIVEAEFTCLAKVFEPFGLLL